MITGKFGERAYIAETQYAMEDGVLVGRVPSPSEGDLSGILDKIEVAIKRISEVSLSLNNKGDQVFGAIPQQDCAEALAGPLHGGIAHIYQRLDRLEGEINELADVARRFERL